MTPTDPLPEQLPVHPPAPLEAPPAVLGALAPALHRLAQLQGAWPPRPAGHPRTVDVPADPAGALCRATGQAVADATADEGVDLLLVDTAADPAGGLAALAALLDLEPVAAVGTAGGAGWAARLAAVRSALPRVRPLVADPEALLDALGDPVLAHLTGLLERAAQRRTPVLLGSSAAAAAGLLLADRLTPGAATWVLVGCSGASPAGRRALDALGLQPALDLSLPGPGGARLADALLRTALELLGG